MFRSAAMRRFAIIVLILGLTTACAQRAAQAPSVCRTEGQRRMCISDAKTCPCEAYGDCGMPGCLAMGEQVAAERDAAAAAPAPVPTVTAPDAEPDPAPEIRAEIPYATEPAAAPTNARGGCMTSADDRQCRDESYYCPCEAYGDCGHTYCVEPAVKPTERIQSCHTEDQRELCRRNPALCPCPADGECGMPECSRAPASSAAPSTTAAPSVPAAPAHAAPAPSEPSVSAPATVLACSTSQDRATCETDPWGCPCEAYGDCGMAGCR